MMPSVAGFAASPQRKIGAYWPRQFDKKIPAAWVNFTGRPGGSEMVQISKSDGLGHC
jgi:hypothetical protein